MIWFPKGRHLYSNELNSPETLNSTNKHTRLLSIPSSILLPQVHYIQLGEGFDVAIDRLIFLSLMYFLTIHRITHVAYRRQIFVHVRGFVIDLTF